MARLRLSSLTVVLLTLMCFGVGIASCTKTEETFYTCRMGDDLDTVMKKLDAEGIRYHNKMQDSSVCLFLENINDQLGVHFDVVQMYFDGAHGRKLGMVAYSSLRSVDSQIDFDQLHQCISEQYGGHIVTDKEGKIECQVGSLHVNAERIDPNAYPGVYLTYIDTLYTTDH